MWSHDQGKAFPPILFIVYSAYFVSTPVHADVRAHAEAWLRTLPSSTGPVSSTSPSNVFSFPHWLTSPMHSRLLPGCCEWRCPKLIFKNSALSCKSTTPAQLGFNHKHSNSPSHSLQNFPCDISSMQAGLQSPLALESHILVWLLILQDYTEKVCSIISNIKWERRQVSLVCIFFCLSSCSTVKVMLECLWRKPSHVKSPSLLIAQKRT